LCDLADGGRMRGNNAQVRKTLIWVTALGLLGLSAGLIGWLLPEALVDRSQGKPLSEGPGLLSAADYVRAVTEERRTVLAGIVAIGAAIGLYLKYQGHELDRDSNRTDRFNSALTNLNSPSPAVRLGAIYSLERVGKDSSRDATTVVDILSALLRAGTRPDDDTQPWPRPERQAAIEVLTRRKEWHENSSWPWSRAKSLAPLDLLGADLSNLSLTNSDLAEANLSRANLSSANLERSDLTNANLEGVDLSGAIVCNANIASADLTVANLTEANLAEANLTEADLTNANIAEANLDAANLTKAQLNHANLLSANLAGATLTQASLWNTNLADANLADANLLSAIFHEAILAAADLTNSDLTNADFTDADLTNADLTDVSGTYAIFTGAKLEGTIGVITFQDLSTPNPPEDD
jgi:uncharacterized protein YjbI with pentapeptide repeats